MLKYQDDLEQLVVRIEADAKRYKEIRERLSVVEQERGSLLAEKERVLERVEENKKTAQRLVCSCAESQDFGRLST